MRRLNRILFFTILLLLLAYLLTACGGQEQKKLEIGDQAPSFRAKDINGDVITLDSYKGKPVILRFWETDCKFCRADTPIFNEYFNSYKDKGLMVFYINSTDTKPSEIREFVDALDIKFPVIIDQDKSISTSYNVRVVPQTIILGPEHRIITAILGGVSEAELQEILGPFLGINNSAKDDSMQPK